MDEHIAALRADFDSRAGRSLSLPLAGIAVWALIGAAGLVASAPTATYVLLFGTGAIFPLALVIARRRGEQLLDNANPLARLMGVCVLMVNLLWALHLTVLTDAPEYLPLTLGIALGLHWVVFSWIVGHRVGVVHAVARTLLVTAGWWLVPEHRITAVSVAVVAAYAYAIATLAARPLNRRALPDAERPASRLRR